MKKPNVLLASLFICIFISGAAVVARADGKTVLRCKDASGVAETLQVHFVRYKNGELKLYNYDNAGKPVEVKSYGPEYNCLIEGEILHTPQ